MSVQATSHHPKTRVDQDYQNGNAIYFSSRNMIEFTWIYPAKTNSNIPVLSLQMYPDGHFMMATAMLELSSYKDTIKISDSASTEHYPSNKAMTDYVNSQILAGKEIFVVNWTQFPEVCQADKTYAEIKAALENDVVTVVGKTKNDGTTYATHEITIATDGKIYFRFIWCDETRGTMEKYFWLQEDEYGSSVPPKPVSQQDWAENNEASASYVKNRPGAYDITDDRIMAVNLVVAPIGRPENEKNYAGMVYTDTCRIYACLVSTNIVGLRDAYNASSIYFTDKGNSADIKEPLHLSSDGKYIYSENYDRDYDSTVGDKRVFKILITLEDNLTIYKITYPKAGIYAANTPDQAGTYWHDSVSWVGKVTTKVKIPNEYIDAPQADWVENDYTAPDYIKNRPGGYTVYHTDTIKANAKDFPIPPISLTRIYVSQNIYRGIILMREDIDGLSLALENGTVESSDSLTWVSGENYYYTNEVFSTDQNEWFPKCVIILKENTTVKGIKFPKIGIYTTGTDTSGHGWMPYSPDFYISWTHNWTEDVKIPEKYLPERTSDNVLAVKFNIDNPENITADHTYEEIKTAYIAGKYVYGYADLGGSSVRLNLQEDLQFLIQNRIVFALDITDLETCITIKNTFFEVSETGITPIDTIYFTKLLQPKTDDMTQKVEAGMDDIGDLYIKPINGNKDLGITGAQVGQIAKITAVDDTGKPTAWSPVDMPSGGGETWETINVITLSDAVNTVAINQDSGGNAIALKKVRILVVGSATVNQDLFLNNSRYIRAAVVGMAASVGALSAEPFCGKMYCFAVTNISANYASISQLANIFSEEITITEIKLIVNNSGTFSAGTKFTIQGVRA